MWSSLDICKAQVSNHFLCFPDTKYPRMQSKSSNALLLLLTLPTVLVVLPIVVMFGATLYANYQVLSLLEKFITNDYVQQGIQF